MCILFFTNIFLYGFYEYACIVFYDAVLAFSWNQNKIIAQEFKNAKAIWRLTFVTGRYIIIFLLKNNLT